MTNQIDMDAALRIVDRIINAETAGNEPVGIRQRLATALVRAFSEENLSILDGSILDPAELATMRKLNEVWTTIVHTWDLRSNGTEATHAVHTLQGFITHHALQRIAPDDFNAWYGKDVE